MENKNFSWDSFLVPYELAIEGFIVKFESIKKQYILNRLYNPIEIVTGRVKTVNSILEKAERLKIEFKDIPEKVFDIAGIRITCKYIPDVYQVLELIKSRKDINIILVKDYVKKPKPSGYRFLHVIGKYNVETLNGQSPIYLEFQIRTHAMHLWASIEHELKYKYQRNIPSTVQDRLFKAGIAAKKVDVEMSKIKETMDKLESKNGIVTAPQTLEEKEITIHTLRKWDNEIFF